MEDFQQGLAPVLIGMRVEAQQSGSGPKVAEQPSASPGVLSRHDPNLLRKVTQIAQRCRDDVKGARAHMVEDGEDGAVLAVLSD
jgi:hypothetical protein